jgi:hypothetical protein
MKKQRAYVIIPIVYFLISQCIVFAGEAFKEIKDREELSTTSVRSVSAQWEVAKKQKDWKKREEVLSHPAIKGNSPNSSLFYEVRTPPFDGLYCLKYGNPELNDIICDMFLYEVDVASKLENKNLNGVATVEKNEIPNDEDGEYCFILSSLALSTFSPKIYDQVWSDGQGERLFYEYVARVEPEKTLSYLLKATLDETYPASEGVEYRIPGKNRLIMLDSLAHLFSRIVILHPQLAEKNARDILNFIKPKALKCAGSKNLKNRDYLARLAVLNILQQIGKTEDIPFIQNSLLKDIPPVPEARFIDNCEDGGMDLKIKAEKVIEIIKKRTAGNALPDTKRI